jgi:hypothetical protein
MAVVLMSGKMDRYSSGEGIEQQGGVFAGNRAGTDLLQRIDEKTRSNITQKHQIKVDYDANRAISGA